MKTTRRVYLYPFRSKQKETEGTEILQWLNGVQKWIGAIFFSECQGPANDAIWSHVQGSVFSVISCSTALLRCYTGPPRLNRILFYRPGTEILRPTGQ